MADWSTLPDELLHLISQHLPTSIDRLRFRSVCPTWRAAASPPPHAAARFSIMTGSGCGYSLSKRTVYLLQPPLPDHPSWIIKLDWTDPARMRLIHPIFGTEFENSHEAFPKYFSFLNVRLRELGEEYKLKIFYPQPQNFPYKVAVLNDGRGGFVVLGMDNVLGRLMVLKSCDDEWRFIDALPSPYGDDFPAEYADIIFWGGRFYAVDYSARILLVNTDDFSVRVLLNMMFSGVEYYFVGSDEELLLLGYYYDGRIRLFRLGIETEKWSEIAADLGDKILFGCSNCSFLASAADIFGYDDKFRGAYLLESSWRSNDTLRIYAIESDRIVSIDNSLPIELEKIFWPPPDWVIEML